MFSGEAQVRDYLARKIGILDGTRNREGFQNLNPRVKEKRTRGVKTVHTNFQRKKEFKKSTIVTSTAKGVRLQAVGDDTDDDMSPLEILKKRRGRTSIVAIEDMETQDQYTYQVRDTLISNCNLIF